MIKVSSFNKEVEQAGQKRFGPDVLLPAFLFICLLWLVFWLDANSSFKYYKLGIFPRSFFGLLGILFSPLIHGSLGHLGNNTLPILVLGTGLFYFYPQKAYRVVLYAWLGSGLLVWLFARPSYHIGASGLIYALAGFILLSGILRRQPNLMALSFLVIFLYGSLVWGVLPIDEQVSHEAHLSGGLVGFALAIVYRHVGPQRKSYSWEREEGANKPLPAPQEKEEWKKYYSEQKNIQYHYKPRDKSSKS